MKEWERARGCGRGGKRAANDSDFSFAFIYNFITSRFVCQSWMGVFNG